MSKLDSRFLLSLDGKENSVMYYLYNEIDFDRVYLLPYDYKSRKSYCGSPIATNSEAAKEILIKNYYHNRAILTIDDDYDGIDKGVGPIVLKRVEINVIETEEQTLRREHAELKERVDALIKTNKMLYEKLDEKFQSGIETATKVFVTNLNFKKISRVRKITKCLRILNKQFRFNIPEEYKSLLNTKKKSK